jgi:uncharacterized protein (TIGR03083 family)
VTSADLAWFAPAMTLDYLGHLRKESARFMSVLRDAPADGQVPSCPDWRTEDLLWHLGEVQHLWGTVVRDGLTDPDGYEEPVRPRDRAALLAFFEEATSTLQTALAGTDPAAHRWTWSEDQTVGFILRRQAHEALIHRIDAELTADVARDPVDPALAADGVDEALRVMFGGCPPWATMVVDRDASVRLRCGDTGDSWLVHPAAFSGTSPRGNIYESEPTIEVEGTDDRRPATATVEGAAADLDCWLWGRPTIGEVERDGSEQVLARLQEVIAEGIE